MSIVLVALPGAPQVSIQAKQKEAELDKLLESKVNGEIGRIVFHIFFVKLAESHAIYYF